MSTDEPRRRIEPKHRLRPHYRMREQSRSWPTWLLRYLIAEPRDALAWSAGRARCRVLGQRNHTCHARPCHPRVTAR